MDPLKRYEYHRKFKEECEGYHNPGALGIEGWKACKAKTIRELYEAGKLTVMQAVRFGMTVQDHSKMLASCPRSELAKRIKELASAGVDLRSLRIRF